MSLIGFVPDIYPQKGQAGGTIPPPSTTGVWYSYGAEPNMAPATRVAYARAICDQFVAQCFTQTGMPSGMPAGAWRVKRNDQNNDTVSEGIGYGMFAMLFMGADPTSSYYMADARAKFDGLVIYSQFYLTSTGLMNWHAFADGSRGTGNDSGGASDGDFDIAFLLLLAHRIWGSTTTLNYKALAEAYITAVKNYEFVPTTGYSNPNVMCNGDQWGFNTDNYMPDYFAPAWFREFYNHTGDSRWQAIIATNYPLARGYFDSHYSTGMVPDACTRAGAPVSGYGYGWGYNAIRSPWRTVVDFLWNGSSADPLAHTQATKLANFGKTQSGGNPANLKAEYSLDGTQFANYTNLAYVSAFGLAASADAANSQFAADCLQWLYDHRTTDGTYFGIALASIASIILAGIAKFPSETPPSTGGGSTTPTSYGTWTLQYFEDFPTTAAEGSLFTEKSGTNGYLGYGNTDYPEWRAYPSNYQTTDKLNHYAVSNMSIVSGIAGANGNVLQMRMYKGSDGKLWCAAPYPYPFSNGGQLYQTYGRYSVRLKTSGRIPGYHIAWLLWPQTDDNGTLYWPQAGETDGPEGDTNGTINAYMHWYGGTSGGSQDAYGSSTYFDQWNTFDVEWKPNSLEYFLNGVSIGHSTGSHVVPNPMRWIAQSESAGTTNASQLLIWLDSVAIWSYTP